MPRRPKLVAIQTLVPTYLKEDLRTVGRSKRRSLSAFVAEILMEWYHEDYKKSFKENEEHGSEEKIES